MRTNLAPLTAAILNRRALSLSELARPLYARNAPRPPPAGAKSASFASSLTLALTPSSPNVLDARYLPVDWPQSRDAHYD